MYQLLTPEGFYTVNVNCSNYPNKMTSTAIKYMISVLFSIL